MANVANGSEATGARGSKLQWRPVRPSQQDTIDADERQARADRARIINETKTSRSDRVTLRPRDRQIDFHVRPVANVQPGRSGADAAQPDADASADPLGAQPPVRSPFGNIATRQPSEPTPMADEMPSVAQPRDAEPPAFPGDEPPTRTEPREPGRLDLPDTQRLPPGVTDDPTPGSPLELTPPDESRAPDPKQDCDTAVARYRADKLSSTKSRTILDIRPSTDGQVPFECTLTQNQFAIDTGRDWPGTTYTWKASALCHKPLYFEQSHMERYGHSWGPVLDPVISGAHFFATLPVLPYKMGVELPCECIYPLGHYRPGSCAPCYIEPWPVSIRGAAFEAGAIVGLSGILP